jgi:outer membrane protein
LELVVIRNLALASLAASLLAGTASADTLREALVSTYNTNPTITAQRQALESTDATVAIARAAGRPQVSATAGVNQDLTRTGGGNGRNLSAGVDVSYPLFNGGSVRNSIRAAQTRVEAGRATLRAVEGDVFTEGVSAYMDVIRDRAIVELNQNQVQVLRTNLQATRDRFEIGDLTRTDVAQSEARLQLAVSNLALAQARLAGSEENYRRVIGHRPDTLAPPPPLPPLPTSPEQAVRIALASNPDLLAINQSARAAGIDVRVAEAGRLPTVSAIGSGRYTNYLGTAEQQFAPGAANSTTSTGAGVQARIPVYQGGLPAARIRQAQAIQGQLQEQVVGTERAVVANTRSAFASYQAAKEAIESNQVAVSANELALEGARAEQSVGTRTVLDVLNAEQELLNSQVALVSAKRDAYVAGFQLLNAMGQAEAQDLGLDGGPLYDPLGNYRRVAGNWSDWAGEPRHPTAATRTVSPEELPPNPAVTPQVVPVAKMAPPPATSGVTQPPQ